MMRLWLKISFCSACIYIYAHYQDMHGNLAINRPGELWHISFNDVILYGSHMNDNMTGYLCELALSYSGRVRGHRPKKNKTFMDNPGP